MKPNLYILLVFVLSFSFANAQSNDEANKEETVKTVSVETATEKVKEEVTLINAEDLKATIARGTSEIRRYFNHERKVDNISLLFPKINKAQKA